MLRERRTIGFTPELESLHTSYKSHDLTDVLHNLKVIQSQKELKKVKESLAPAQNQIRPSELEPERIVLFKKGLLIEQAYYICEISYNKRGYFISLFSIQDLNNKMVLHLENSEKTNRMLESYQHDFE